MKILQKFPVKIFICCFLLSNGIEAFAFPGVRNGASVAVKLDPEKMKFEYWSFDGSIHLRCTHKIENEFSQDWRVRCVSDDQKTSRDYSVHLWLTQYLKKDPPKMSVELLFWVTDHSVKPLDFYSSTTWFHFATESKFMGFQTSQGVEGDIAGLYLEYRI